MSKSGERLEAYRLTYGDAAYTHLIYEFGGELIRFPKYIAFPDKDKRNAAIRKDWYSFMDWDELCEKYGLSKDRLRKIINSRPYKAKSDPENNG